MHFLLAIYVRAHYNWLAKNLQSFEYIKNDNNMIVIYPELVLITLFKLRKTSWAKCNCLKLSCNILKNIKTLHQRESVISLIVRNCFIRFGIACKQSSVSKHYRIKEFQTTLVSFVNANPFYTDDIVFVCLLLQAGKTKIRFA